MTFTIRDLLWLTAVAAVAIVGWLYPAKLHQRIAERDERISFLLRESEMARRDADGWRAELGYRIELWEWMNSKGKKCSDLSSL